MAAAADAEEEAKGDVEAVDAEVGGDAAEWGSRLKGTGSGSAATTPARGGGAAGRSGAAKSSVSTKMLSFFLSDGYFVIVFIFCSPYFPFYVFLSNDQ